MTTLNSGEGLEKLDVFINFWQKCKLVQLLQEAVWQFLNEPNMKLSHDPPIAFLGIYLREMKTYAHTKNYIDDF